MKGIGQDLSIIIAGLFAALMQLLIDEEVNSWRMAVMRVFIGCVSSHYGTMAVRHFYNLDLNSASLSGFVCGMSGVYVLAGLIKILKKFRGDPLTVIKKIITK